MRSLLSQMLRSWLRMIADMIVFIIELGKGMVVFGVELLKFLKELFVTLFHEIFS